MPIRLILILHPLIHTLLESNLALDIESINKRSRNSAVSAEKCQLTYTFKEPTHTSGSSWSDHNEKEIIVHQDAASS
jgi:hypothetical protein